MDEVIAASGDATDAFGGNRRGGKRQPEVVDQGVDGLYLPLLRGL
jgi:hypothetical protein